VRPVLRRPSAALGALALLVAIDVAGTCVLDAHLPCGPGEVGLAEAGAAGAEEDVQVRDWQPGPKDREAQRRLGWGVGSDPDVPQHLAEFACPAPAVLAEE